MDTVGQKIRELRLAKRQTRQDLCDDESTLSIRQLIRIEKGESKPNIATLNYIATKLDVHLYELMPDYKELPKRYLELKYWVLRTATYDDDLLLTKEEDCFDEIFNDYYDDLPKEEQLVISCLQALSDVFVTTNEAFGEDILSEHLDKVILKTTYNVPDVLVIRLYFMTLNAYEQREKFSAIDVKNSYLLIDRLGKNIEHFDFQDLFILRDTLILGVGILEILEDYAHFDKVFHDLDKIVEQTQDFQKNPIISMLHWKYALAHLKNFHQAEQHYQEAKQFAIVTHNAYLIEKLEEEWKEDMKLLL